MTSHQPVFPGTGLRLPRLNCFPVSCPSPCPCPVVDYDSDGADGRSFLSVESGLHGDTPRSPRVVVQLGASSFSIPTPCEAARLEALLADASFWRSLDAEGSRELVSLARRIERELQSNEASSASLASAYALEFLILASRRAAAWKDPSGVWRMNTSDFSRRFKDLAGCPLFEFINRQRIKRACAMLKSSKLSIVEIALKVGYNNLSFFNRYFLRIMGVTPRAYKSSR